MASTIYQGHKTRFIFDTKKLLHATSCKISVSTKLEEIATKDTEGSVVTPSNYSWSGSAECLLANLPSGNTTHVTADDILAKQIAKDEIDVDFTTGETGDIIWSGKAYIESFETTADDGSAVKVSISIKGNGDLTQDVN